MVGKVLFRQGDFTLHSGARGNYFIDCDALTDEDWETLAKVTAERFTFGKVVGIPKGGLKLADALEKYKTEGTGVTLIVDDVLTTGKSMEEEKAKHSELVSGIVVFARGYCPYWIVPLFQMPIEKDEPEPDESNVLITKGNEHTMEHREAIIQMETEWQSKIGKIIDVGNEILELAWHGDYSNGNEAFGVDEGRVRAKELLDVLELEWRELKKL